MAVVTAASAPIMQQEARLLNPGQANSAPAMIQSGSESEDDSGTGSDENSANGTIEAPPKPQRAFVPPKVWMIVFGIMLAICAGAVNVITSLGLQVFVSHVTGTVSKIGIAAVGDKKESNLPWGVPKELLLVLSFIFGAFLCGLVIPKNQLHFGGKSFYGVALLGNSVLLIISAFISPKGPQNENRDVLPGCLAAIACGLQNAMCTMHFGAVIRTTHVTGTATDIGSTLGRAVMILLRMGCNPRKGTPVEKVELKDDMAKFAVLTSIMMGFLCGAILGTILHQWIGMYGLLFPAGFTGLSGVLYTFFRTTLKKQFKKWEQRRVSEEMEEIEETLQRAQTLLGSKGGSRVAKPKSQDLEEIDELLHHSLQVAHDMEENLRELVGTRQGRESVARSSTM